MRLKRLILRELFFVFWIQLFVLGNSFLEAKPLHESGRVVHITKTLTKKDILAKSQLSYRAYGGFNEIRSYSVLISCVDGKISTYRAVHDNRRGAFRKNGTMTKEAYLALWDNMLHRQIFNMKNAPALDRDILDQFTTEFEAKVGEASNTFVAVGCSRPEAAQYFALRNLIDQATDMKAVWNLQQNIARK